MSPEQLFDALAEWDEVARLAEQQEAATRSLIIKAVERYREQERALSPFLPRAVAADRMVQLLLAEPDFDRKAAAVSFVLALQYIARTER